MKQFIKEHKTLIQLIIVGLIMGRLAGCQSDYAGRDYHKHYRGYATTIPASQPKTVNIDSGFIYQQELKEDGSYELIAYPKSTWAITKK